LFTDSTILLHTILIFTHIACLLQHVFIIETSLQALHKKWEDRERGTEGIWERDGK